MIEICKKKTNKKTRKSKLTCSVLLTNYDVGTFCRNKSWKWTYVVFDLFFEERNM